MYLKQYVKTFLQKKDIKLTNNLISFLKYLFYGG